MKFHMISKGKAEDRRVKVSTVQCTIFVPYQCTIFLTTLQLVVAARLRNRIYREQRLKIVVFDTMCYVYVFTPNSNCLQLYFYKTSGK